MAQWIEDPQGRQEIEKVTKELKLPVWKANYKGKFREFWNEVWSKIEDNFLNLKNIVENKEPTITKKSGFNLDKTDEYNQDDTNKLGTARALKKLYDFLIGKINAIKLTWDKIENKPSTFPPTSHNHDDRYYTENEIDNKFKDNILHSTGKEYGGILNNIGNKIAGKTYFDNNTKKLFLCLKNNNNTSANTENFIPIDSNSIHERLENLFSSGNSNNINWVKLPSGLLIQWGSKMWGEIKLPKSYQSIDSFSVIASKGNPSSPSWVPQSYPIVTGKLGVDKIFIQSYEKGGNIHSNWITLGF